MVDSLRSEQINMPRPLAAPDVSSSPDSKVEELMRLIRKSDYNIIEQLHHTPSKMSMLSLLIYSKAHRNALMKLLKNAFVPQEITVG